MLEQIVARTDGIPLYVEELTKSVTEAGDGETEVPETLQASLLSRLDRLGPAKEIAQIGAVIGREFEFPLLASVAQRRQEDLITAIDRLVDALLVFQTGEPPTARYIFKHALVQDAAYDSLLKSRRETLHGQIASALERDFPAVGEGEPEILARHHAAAGDAEPAIEYLRRAGERAAALSSGLEACNHFERALSLLDTLPASPERDEMDLTLQLNHAWALQMTRGPADADMGNAYARALDLSAHLGEPAQRTAAMFGMWRHNFWRHGPEAARPFADDLKSIVEKSSSVPDQVLALYTNATTHWTIGNDAQAVPDAQLAWDLYKESSEGSLTYRLGHNQGVSALLIMGSCQWALGRPAMARAAVEELLFQVQSLPDPLSQSVVRPIAGAVLEMLGEERRDNIEAAHAQAQKYGFAAWEGYADTCRGWLAHLDGDSETGLALMQQGIDAWRASGSRSFIVDRLAVFGRMCTQAGQFERARKVLADGEQIAEESGEKFWLTEIHRALGLLALADGGDQGVAEEYFRRALDAAVTRGAYGFALRAAIDLAALLSESGQREQAQ